MRNREPGDPQCLSACEWQCPRRMRVLRWLILALLLTLTLSVPLPPRRAAVTALTYRAFLPMVARDAHLKKGIAPNYLNCEDWTRVGATWMYVYGAPTNWECPGVESLAMINSPEQIGVEPGGNSDYLLAFNEPDASGLTPEQVARYWRQIEDAYPEYKLISPVPTQDNIVRWLQQFYAAYVEQNGQSPRLAGLALHCYHPTAAYCINLAERVIELANRWGVAEVWVTEFGLSDCWEPWEKLVQEATKLVHWMEEHVTRYAWYTNRTRGDEYWWPAPVQCRQNLFDYFTNQRTRYGDLYASLP